MYRILNHLSLICYIFFISSLFINDKINLLIPLSFILILIWIVIKYSVTNSSLDIYSYLFAIFILFGVVLKTSFHLYEYDMSYRSVYFSYGDFTASSIEYIYVFILILLGTLSFAAAKRCFEMVCGKHRYFGETSATYSTTSTCLIIVAYLVSSFMLSHLLFSNEIGIHGIEPKQLYFNGLAGLLVYIRWIVIPMVFLSIYEIRIRNAGAGVTYTFYLAFGVWALVYLYHSQTKAALLLLLLPFALDKIGIEHKTQHPNLKTLLSLGFFTIIGFASVVVIAVSRNAIFQKIETSFVDLVMSVPIASYFKVIEGIARRIEGFREVAAVSSHSGTNILDLLQITLGGYDVAGQIFNVTIQQEGMSFGLTLGLLGNAALAQNILIFCCYIFIIFFMVFILSAMIIKRGGKLPYYYFCCTLFLIVWSGISMFFAYRLFAMLLVYNCIMLLFIRSTITPSDKISDKYQMGYHIKLTGKK